MPVTDDQLRAALTINKGLFIISDVNRDSDTAPLPFDDVETTADGDYAQACADRGSFVYRATVEDDNNGDFQLRIHHRLATTTERADLAQQTILALQPAPAPTEASNRLLREGDVVARIEVEIAALVERLADSLDRDWAIAKIGAYRKVITDLASVPAVGQLPEVEEVETGPRWSVRQDESGRWDVINPEGEAVWRYKYRENAESHARRKNRPA